MCYYLNVHFQGQKVKQVTKMKLATPIQISFPKRSFEHVRFPPDNPQQQCCQDIACWAHCSCPMLRIIQCQAGSGVQGGELDLYVYIVNTAAIKTSCMPRA